MSAPLKNRRTRGSRAAWLMVVVLALGVAAQPSIGSAAVRYRDRVFSSVSVSRGIVYGRARNNRGQMQDLILDLYQPAGDGAAKRAAIVFAHGGSFVRGSRSDADIVKIVTDYAKHGFVVASIDYRLRPAGSPGYQSPPELILSSYTTGAPTIRDAQHDMQAAVRYLRASASFFRIDKPRIVAAGNSAGAVIALATNYRPEDHGSGGNPGYSSAVAGAVSIAGAEAAHAIGPLESPIIMFHGTNDTTVPFPLAAITCATALALVNICEMNAYPGAQHSLSGHGTEIIDRSCAFLYTHVILGPKKGILKT